MSDPYSNENLRLQIEMAAKGSVDGTLKDWPLLESALHHFGYTLSEDTRADYLRNICHELITESDDPRTKGMLAADEHYPFNIYTTDWLGSIIANCGQFSFHARPDAVIKANVRRLIACWNACIGVPTKFVETIAVIPGLSGLIAEEAADKETIKQLTSTSHPEQILLDALQEIRNAAEFYNSDTVVRLVDEGITKFKEEKERIAAIPPY